MYQYARTFLEVTKIICKMKKSLFILQNDNLLTVIFIFITDNSPR